MPYGLMQSGLLVSDSEHHRYYAHTSMYIVESKCCIVVLKMAMDRQTKMADNVM